MLTPPDSVGIQYNIPLRQSPTAPPPYKLTRIINMHMRIFSVLSSFPASLHPVSKYWFIHGLFFNKFKTYKYNHNKYFKLGAQKARLIGVPK